MNAIANRVYKNKSERMRQKHSKPATILIPQVPLLWFLAALNEWTSCNWLYLFIHIIMVIQIFKTFDGSAKAKGKVPCFATHYLEENSTMGRGGQRINHQRWVEVVNALIISMVKRKTNTAWCTRHIYSSPASLFTKLSAVAWIKKYLILK